MDVVCITLGGAYDGGRAHPVGVRCHVFRCSGGMLAAAAAAA